jgi:hypothetical protein
LSISVPALGRSLFAGLASGRRRRTAATPSRGHARDAARHERAIRMTITQKMARLTADVKVTCSDRDSD